MRRDDSFRALCDYVQRAGARIEFKPIGSGHREGADQVAGRTRFIILSMPPRGPNRKEVLRDARRVLRELSITTESWVNAGRTIPTSLRRPEQRFAANSRADAILRAEARKRRAAAMPKPTTKKAPSVEAGPRRLHLAI